MADQSFFGQPAASIFNASEEALKKQAQMKALQEAFAKSEMEANKAKDINQDKAKTDMVTQALTQPQTASVEAGENETAAQDNPQEEQAEGFHKPGKGKLFDVQDLIPTILGAIIGGVAGGPAGALMGAAGGMYKGQESRKKYDLANLGEYNDIVSQQLANEDRDAALAYRQKQDVLANQFRERGLTLQEKVAQQNAQKDLRTTSQKDYEFYVKQALAKGEEPMSFADFKSNTDPAFDKIIEDYMKQKFGTQSAPAPSGPEPIQIP